MIASSEKGPLERLLSVISDVRPGESQGTLLLTLDLALLLGAYYLLKTVRESLILAESGAEVKAYSSAAQAIILLAVVPLYGWIATHLNRNRLIRWTTLFFASNLIVFYFIGRAGFREGVVYYIWVGIFNVFIVAQLWAFAADLFTEEQGKRLFPVLGIGASVGAVGGAWAAGKLIGPVGPYNLMLVSAFALCACALLSRLASYVVTKRQGETEKQKNTEPLGSAGGFQLILSDPYLRLIAILTVLLNIVIGSGDFIFGKLLVAHANDVVGTADTVMNARKAYIGAFYANYYGWINLVSFLIQSFLVSRIFKRIGIRASLFVLPALSLATFLSILAYPVLGVVPNFEDWRELCELLFAKHCKTGAPAADFTRGEVQSERGHRHLLRSIGRCPSSRGHLCRIDITFRCSGFFGGQSGDDDRLDIRRGSTLSAARTFESNSAVWGIVGTSGRTSGSSFANLGRVGSMSFK
jgi:AAA family ATP:ADP antiporter